MRNRYKPMHNDGFRIFIHEIVQTLAYSTKNTYTRTYINKRVETAPQFGSICSCVHRRVLFRSLIDNLALCAMAVYMFLAFYAAHLLPRFCYSLHIQIIYIFTVHQMKIFLMIISKELLLPQLSLIIIFAWLSFSFIDIE